MSVFNAEDFIQEAVGSVLQQTFSDFEFIIVDDASTDGTLQRLRSYRDTRIRIFCNEINMGLTRSLNKGLEFVQGEYIARMDADDISFPDRFQEQKNFLDAHPEVGVCGTWVRVMDTDIEYRYYADHSTIVSKLLLGNAFAHPSVMMRKSVLDAHGLKYDETFRYAQDYDLWVRLAEHTKLANLKKVLLHYRLHENCASKKNAKSQQETVKRVLLEQVHKLGITASLEEQRLHMNLVFRQFECSRTFVTQAEKWLLKLLEINQKKRFYNNKALGAVISERWFAVCNHCTVLGVWLAIHFFRSPLRSFLTAPGKQRMKFVLKCFRESMLR